MFSGKDEEEDMGFMKVIAKSVVSRFVMRRGVVRGQETNGAEEQEREDRKAGRAGTASEREVLITARCD